MSASLVGSEMCIRDRFCAALRADAESADEMGRRARRRHFSGGPGGGAPPGCLLYTSDAADDM
eukprot:10860134-Alexandrium_andersonii.AAC.1